MCRVFQVWRRMKLMSAPEELPPARAPLQEVSLSEADFNNDSFVDKAQVTVCTVLRQFILSVYNLWTLYGL